MSELYNVGIKVCELDESGELTSPFDTTPIAVSNIPKAKELDTRSSNSEEITTRSMLFAEKMHLDEQFECNAHKITGGQK